LLAITWANSAFSFHPQKQTPRRIYEYIGMPFLLSVAV
jgi:hypothetical protein